MEKNNMMRLASGLLVLCLLTTCAISGTFAKYTTTDSATDSARVAKWGVSVSTEGKLFAESYTAHDTTTAGDSITNTVVAETSVVAPGTSSSDTGITFKISGTPEVAVDVKIDVDEDTLKDVFLAAETYTDPTGTVEGGTYTLAKEYRPLVFTLKNTSGVVATGTLAAVMEAFEGESAQYAAGEKLDETYTLTWAWAYGTYGTYTTSATTSVAADDVADTILGNLAAAESSGEGYSTEASLAVSITVTQID